MDRLLAINRQLVIYWNHWLVLETLKYLLRTSNTEDDLSLVSKYYLKETAVLVIKTTNKQHTNQTRNSKVDRLMSTFK